MIVKLTKFDITKCQPVEKSETLHSISISIQSGVVKEILLNGDPISDIISQITIQANRYKTHYIAYGGDDYALCGYYVRYYPENAVRNVKRVTCATCIKRLKKAGRLK